MGRLRRAALCTLLTLVVCLPCAATEEPLRTSASPQFSNGINTAIARAFAARLGHRLEVRQATFARTLEWLKSGRIDLRAGLNRTTEREKYILFLQPPYLDAAQNVFFVRSGSNIHIHNHEDLHGLRIATSINSTYSRQFDHDIFITRVPVAAPAQKFRMLMLGRVDAVIHSIGGGLRLMHDLELDDKVEMTDYSFTSDSAVYLGVSRTSPLAARRKELETTLKTMVESGEIDDIIIQQLRNLHRAEAEDDN